MLWSKKIQTALMFGARGYGWLFGIIFSSLLIFSPAMNNFFLGDDWFHLKVVQIENFGEFLNFFNPVPNPQSTAFYRPIPNQLFFFVFYSLFGLQAQWYHLFILAIFATSVVLFYTALRAYRVSKSTALVATALFAFSHTHFSRVYFVSASQELMMNIFFLWAVIKNKTAQTMADYLRLSGLFILALLCKENIVVLPGIVAILDWVSARKIDWKKLSVLGVVAVAYIFFRVFVVGFSMTSDATEAYQLNLSPKLAANTLYFYSLWSLGGRNFYRTIWTRPCR